MIALAVLALVACKGAGDPAPPLSVEPEAPRARQAAPAPPPKAAKPLPTPPDPALGTTTLEGYGVALDLRPPFQAMRARFADADDHLVLTWWDVSTAGAGGHVARGLYSVALVPGAPSAKDDTLARIDRDDEHMPVAFRLGSTGTEVRLGAPLQTLEQIGATLRRSDHRGGWRIDGQPEEAWPRHQLLQSADPASGATYEVVDRPTRPWGPWPATDAQGSPE